MHGAVIGILQRAQALRYLLVVEHAKQSAEHTHSYFKPSRSMPASFIIALRHSPEQYTPLKPCAPYPSCSPRASRGSSLPHDLRSHTCVVFGLAFICHLIPIGALRLP